MDPQKARRALEQDRERLENLAAAVDQEGLDEQSETDSLSELSSADQHPADIGTETFERTKDLAILEGIQGDLADVAHALRKIEEGTYGRCEVCGRPIPDDRLEAVPAARFCIEDQAKMEREMRASSGSEPPHGLF